jgi:hypothetical protein
LRQIGIVTVDAVAWSGMVVDADGGSLPMLITSASCWLAQSTSVARAVSMH